MDNLTKDARLLLSCIYRKYRSVRSERIPKAQAQKFEQDFYLSEERISSWLDADVQSTLAELHKAGYVKRDIIGGFKLLDNGINAVESRLPDALKDGLIDIASIIASLLG